MGEPLVVAALDRCRERVGSLIDRFGRLLDRLRRLFGAADDGMKLAMGACSLFAAGHLVAQRGHFVPGALDRGIDQAELVAEGQSLRDLRPRPLQRIAVDTGARPDQVT